MNKFVEALQSPIAPGEVSAYVPGQASQNATAGAEAPQTKKNPQQEMEHRLFNSRANPLLNLSEHEKQLIDTDTSWSAQNAASKALDVGTSVLAVGAGMMIEAPVLPVAGMAGGLSALMAAVDGNEKTESAMAFTKTVEAVSTKWHEYAQAGMDALATNEKQATHFYEYIGEKMEEGVHMIGMSAVRKARAFIKPVGEAFGAEWTPEREAVYYAATTGAAMTALFVLPFKKAPGRVGSPLAKGLDNRAGRKAMDALDDPANSPNNFPPKPDKGFETFGDVKERHTRATAKRKPAEVEAINKAFDDAVAEGLQAAAMEDMWAMAADEATSMGYSFDLVDFALQDGALDAGVQYRQQRMALEAVIQSGKDPETGKRISKKAKKKLRETLKAMKADGAPRRMSGYKQLPKPSDVDAPYTTTKAAGVDAAYEQVFDKYDLNKKEWLPPERGLDDPLDFMPTLSKEWYFKHVYQGWDSELPLGQQATRTAPQVATGSRVAATKALPGMEARLSKLKGVISARGEKGPTKTQAGRLAILQKQIAKKKAESDFGPTETMHTKSPEFEAAYTAYVHRQYGVNQKIKWAEVAFRDVWGQIQDPDVATAARQARRAKVARELNIEAIEAETKALKDAMHDSDPASNGDPIPRGQPGEGTRPVPKPFNYWWRADPELIKQSHAGEQALKGNSIQLNEVGYVSAMAKMVEKVSVDPTVLGPDGMKFLQIFMQRHGKAIDYGANFQRVLTAMREIEAKDVAGREFVQAKNAKVEWLKMPQKGRLDKTTGKLEIPKKGAYGEPALPEGITFNTGERLALLKELYSMEEVIRHPEHGIIRKGHDVSSLGEQANAKHGPTTAAKGEPGTISATGRFYTPQEAAFMRGLVEDVVGVDLLLLGLEELNPTVLGKELHGPVLPRSFQFGVGLQDIPASVQYTVAHKFGIALDRMYGDVIPGEAVLGVDSFAPTRPAHRRANTGTRHPLSKQDLSLTEAGFRRPEKARDYPADTAAVEQKNWDTSQRIQDEWRTSHERGQAAEAAYDAQRTPWGKRLDAYHTAKSVKARDAKRTQMVKEYWGMRENLGKMKAHMESQRNAADMTHDARVTALDRLTILEQGHFVGGVEAEVANWVNASKNKRMANLILRESPTYEQYKQVAADSGYASQEAMLRDMNMDGIRMIAQELGIAIDHTPGNKTFLRKKGVLVAEILAVDREVMQLSWKERQTIDAIVPSVERVNYVEKLNVRKAFDEVGESDVWYRRSEAFKKSWQKERQKSVRPMPDPFAYAKKPTQIDSAKVNSWLDDAMEQMNSPEEAIKQSEMPRSTAEIAADIKSLGRSEKPGSSAGQVIVNLEAKSKLLKEYEKAAQFEEVLEVSQHNARKRSNPKVLPEATPEAAIKLAKGKKWKAQRLNIAKGVKLGFEGQWHQGTLVKRSIYVSKAAELAKTELKVEMLAVKNAKIALRKKQAAESKAYNAKRNAYLRDRMEKTAEGRHMQDRMTGNKRPAYGPIAEAQRIEKAIMNGLRWEDVIRKVPDKRKTKNDMDTHQLQEERTGLRKSKLPKDLEEWAEGVTEEKRSTGRGTLNSNPLGQMADEGAKAMVGVFRYVAKRFKPEQGRVYDAAGGRNVQQGKQRTHGQAKEVFFGAQTITPFTHKLKGLIGKVGADHPAVQALGSLYQDFGALPHWVWTKSMGSEQSFYNMRTKLRGLLITGGQHKGSLAHAIQTHGGQWFTGARDWMPQFMSGTRGGMTKAMNQEALYGLLGIGPDTPLVKALREVMDNSYGLMQRSIGDYKKLAPYVKDYFPMKLKKGISLLEQDALVDTIMANGRRKGKKLDINVVGNQVRSMAGEDGWMQGRMGIRDPRTHAREHWNAEKTRTLLDGIDPNELLPFIETDVAHSLTTYLNAAADRAAYGFKFGANDQKLLGKIQKVNTELNKVGESLTVADQALIEDMLKITQREYHVPGSKWWTDSQRVGIAVANWAKLGMVVPGSLVEMMIPLRNRTMASHWLPALAHTVATYPARATVRQIWRAKPGEKGWGAMGYDAIVGEVIGKVVNVSDMDLLTANHAGDLGSKYSNAAFIANGLHVMTNVLQTATIRTFRKSMENFAMREGEMKAGRMKRSAAHQEDLLMFEYYGIKPEAATAWVKGGMKKDGAFFMRNYGPALIKYMQENVMTAQGVNQPRWHSNSNFAFLRHLKTYVTMFGNTVVPDIWHKGTANVFVESPQHAGLRTRNATQVTATAAAMYYIADGSEEIMDWWKYGGSKRHPINQGKNREERKTIKAARAVNRWAITGIPGMVAYDIWESAQYQGRGFGDEGAVQDLMSGAAGKDAIRGLLLVAASFYNMATDGHGAATREQAAAWMTSQMPMVSALPRNRQSPAASWMLNKETVYKMWLQAFKEIGI